MAESDGDTQPNTPDSFKNDLFNQEDNDDVFAWLRPHSSVALDAFDASIDSIIKSPERYDVRRFVIAQRREGRAGSTYTEDGEKSEASAPQWSGAFKLSLTQLPRSPAHGWSLGTSRGRNPCQVDFLLAPSTEKWANITTIAGKHARLFFHEETCRIMIEARHTVTMTKTGATVIRGSTCRVIEHGELIEIGPCSYVFELTDLYSSQSFQHELASFMSKYVKPSWRMNELVSPATVGEPFVLGDYYCSASAFAQGTFGKISVGWGKDGRAVVIKQFKAPVENELREHERIMNHIGEHPNIMRLLECVSHCSTAAPSAFCVYSPVAASNLGLVLKSYDIDFAAKMSLFLDYLRGLSFLHDKGVMHRDLSLGNPTVSSFANPQGIIIDLDSATSAPNSVDHRKGTLIFLAPEIMKLKGGGGTRPYDRAVDTWALGLCMFSLYTGQHFHWHHFKANADQRGDFVDQSAYTEFRSELTLGRESARGPFEVGFLGLVGRLTEYDKDKRISAAEALVLAQEEFNSHEKGVISLRSTKKRAFAAIA